MRATVEDTRGGRVAALPSRPGGAVAAGRVFRAARWPTQPGVAALGWPTARAALSAQYRPMAAVALRFRRWTWQTARVAKRRAEASAGKASGSRGAARVAAESAAGPGAPCKQWRHQRGRSHASGPCPPHLARIVLRGRAQGRQGYVRAPLGGDAPVRRRRSQRSGDVRLPQRGISRRRLGGRRPRHSPALVRSPVWGVASSAAEGESGMHRSVAIPCHAASLPISPCLPIGLCLQ